MSAFLVKLDENLGRSHLELLRGHGYDADTVHAERLSGAPDATLWSRVVAEGRFLVTLDLDFSDVRRFQPGTHPGHPSGPRPERKQWSRAGGSASSYRRAATRRAAGMSVGSRRAHYADSAPESLAKPQRPPGRTK
jgi:hypothetical protein